MDYCFEKKIRNSHVTLWNYTLLRYQIFLVYFIAGLKKTEWDWVAGYSMDSLGDHWVFSPFRTFMTIEQITWLLVHVCGLLSDLFIGFAKGEKAYFYTSEVQKYEEVPRSTKKYLEVPRSPEKYLGVRRSPKKYEEARINATKYQITISKCLAA
ncbi:unnamed protein product [Rotaria magnacalcarata]|uniref:HTTM domain-containing protein n=2 Tax=Rotaria magnacalcarata TaxID=392030 RepID=A0A814WZI3_9BILA|nr:unnamed protein product [Rotaria magnacalcarata]